MDSQNPLLARLLDRRRLLTVSTAGTTAFVLAKRGSARQGTPAATPVAVMAEWSLPGANVAGTRAAVTSIDSGNVASLAPAWATDIGGVVAGTPVIAGGSVFVVTWDGVIVALDLTTGDIEWTYDMGASVPDPMFGGAIGASDGAAVTDGVVYAGDAAVTLHAVDAATGKARWTVKVDDQVGSAVLAAPNVWNGLVFAPVDVMGGDGTFRGNLNAVSAADGSVAWKRHFAVEAGNGGASASTPAIDADTGRLFASVGASNSAPPSVFALDAATGDVIWQTPIDATPETLEGLSAPIAAINLFTIEVDGIERPVVGAGFPDGVYLVYDRTDGSLVWELTAAYSGPFGGIIGAAATAVGKVVVPATNWRTVDAPANGVVMAADAATGAFAWMSVTSAPAQPPVSIANDVVLYGGLDGIVRADSLSDGVHLWSDQLDASIGSGIAVLDRTIVFGTGATQIGPFVKPGSSVVAYGLSGEGTPVPSSAGEPDATPAATATVAQAPSPEGEVFHASMQSLKFVPPEIDITADTTVIWTNEDTVAHTVTHRARVEDQLFSSPFLTPGQTFSYTFDKPGTYPIYCLPHPFMTETVVVS